MIQAQNIKPVPLCRLREEHIPPVSLFCPGMRLRLSANSSRRRNLVQNRGSRAIEFFCIIVGHAVTTNWSYSRSVSFK